jgi:hypothetical protein
MNWYPLLALVAFAYAAAVFYIVIAKPPALMKIGKLQAIERLLGKRGAEIFYYAWGSLAVLLGIWALLQ